MRTGFFWNPSDEIIITVGTNKAVFITMMALLDPDDEVLISGLCWLHYFSCAEMAGARSVCVPLKGETGFQLKIEDLESLVTFKTKMLVINTPRNPTGMLIDKEVMDAIAQFVKRHDLYVLSDEIYEKIVYGDAKHISIASLPGMRERTVMINGFSKIYSVTG